MPRPDGRRAPGHHRCRDRRVRPARRHLIAQRVVGLTGATLEHAPRVCQTCVWWQSRPGRTVAKERWIEKTEDDWGAWGALYRDDDGRAARLDPVRPYAALSPRRRASRRPAVRRRGARHLRLRRLERDAVGRAVALPRGDRRGARQGRQGARGVRLPLSGGRVDLRALSRPPHGLPARLPRRLRLPAGPGRGKGRARSARARRAGAGRRGEAGERAAGRQGGVRARARPAAARSGQRQRPSRRR